ncbi:MAG: phosphate signaling complex protein PhoU [Geminicoccaceae bacterium]
MANEHIVKSYDDDLEQLSTHIVEMGGLAERQVAMAVQCLAKRDVAIAEAVIDRDAEVDALEEEIDRLAVQLLATRQPMAGDLRQIAMALKMSNDLERISDYAVNVAKRSRRLLDFPQISAIQSLVRMGHTTQDMLKDVLDAFINRDTTTAMAVWHRDEEVDALYDSVFREILTYVIEDPRTTSGNIDLLFIAKNFERIGDHATNLAERIHYVLHGEAINRVREKGD